VHENFIKGQKMVVSVIKEPEKLIYSK
jgi:hypothetical protein